MEPLVVKSCEGKYIWMHSGLNKFMGGLSVLGATE